MANVIHHQVGHTTGWATPPGGPLLLQNYYNTIFLTMIQPKRTQLKSNEANINMAMQAIDLDQFGSNRSAAVALKFAKNKLGRLRKGVPARRDCTPNSKNLTELEEYVIVDHALDLDMRGYQLTYDLL